MIFHIQNFYFEDFLYEFLVSDKKKTLLLNCYWCCCFFPKKSLTMIAFFQAVDEPEFSQAYARMCEVLSGKKVTNDESSGQKPMNFQRMMITRCQKEFERDYMEG